jgi:hypothetical protein
VGITGYLAGPLSVSRRTLGGSRESRGDIHVATFEWNFVFEKLLCCGHPDSNEGGQ